MEGWISLHRKIKDHWIWTDGNKFKWWIDLLLSVNHCDTKVNIGFQLFDCKRGQSLKSLSNWANEWNVSKDTVRNFFELLKKDGMILTENVKKTTRITICNYDTYQIKLHDEQTQSKRKANAKQTQAHPNNNDNNLDNENNKNKYDEFISKFNAITKGSYKGCKKSRAHFNTRLKEKYSMLDFEIAINNAMQNDKLDKKYLTPEYILRDDKLQLWLNAKSQDQKSEQPKKKTNDYETTGLFD